MYPEMKKKHSPNAKAKISQNSLKQKLAATKLTTIHQISQFIAY